MSYSSKRFHLIIDAIECDTKLINDKTRMKKAIRKVAQLSKMQIIHGPLIIEGRPHNPGLTAFAVIDYSHISIHSFSSSRALFVDVFSCKPFNSGIIKEYIKKTFDLDEVKLKITKYNLD